MSSLFQDLRYGLRVLAKQRGFATIALLTLTLGIGANTAVFTVFYTVLLRSLPYAGADELVVILAAEGREGGRGPTSRADFSEWREQATSFTDMSAAEAWGPTLTGENAAEKITGLRASTNLFRLLGAEPMLGRGFQPEDGRPGSERVVVLSHGLWQSRFGEDADIIGRSLRLDGEQCTVVGVMPPGFRFPTFWITSAEIWTPLMLAPNPTDRGRSLRIFARLNPGVDLASAQSEMSTISARLSAQYPETNAELGAAVVSLHEMTVGEVKPTLVVLAGAVGLLLLIACVNIASLLLARATSRSREIAVRLALGAGRSRLVRQLLAESLVLSVIAGALGALFASWAVSFTLGNIPDTWRVSLPRRAEIGVDADVLLFSLLLSLAATLLFGLAPALQAVRPRITAGLREGGRGTTAGGKHLRGGLVVAEVALSVMLLIAAGLMIRSFVKLQAIDPGFKPDKVVSMVVPVTGSQFGVPEKKALFYRELVSRAEALPGVRSVSLTNHIPLEGDIWGTNFRVEGRPPRSAGDVPGAAYRVIMPGYFQTMGATLLGGRDFDDRDTEAAPYVAIINETMARRHWPDDDPLGKRIRRGRSGDAWPWLTIVGVVKDLQQFHWADVDEELYLPFAQDESFRESPRPPFAMTLVARTDGDPGALASALRQTVAGIDTNVPVANIVTLEQAVSNALWRPRFSMLLLGVFATLALVLAGVGVYGVISYAVSQRTAEIGIRAALGADTSDVLRLILTQGLALAAAGIALGLVAAFGLSRLMASLLYEVDATDWLTFVSAATALALVAASACIVPALRAIRIDPITALRYE